MASNGQSSLQSILENLRDFAVGFGKPYQVPENIPTALNELLATLGIANPTHVIPEGLATVAASWGTISNALSGIQFVATDPISSVREIAAQAEAIEKSIGAITKVPVAAWNGISASGQAIADVFPRRLLDYIVYESLGRSHPKIAGAFLLFGVLRKDRVTSVNPAFLPEAMIRVFDLAQLMHVLTNPREAILTAFKWGTDDFNAQPFADGMALLVGLLPGATRGPDDSFLPTTTEALWTRVPVAPGALPSASHTVTIPTGGGTTTLTFTGLHHLGFGVGLPNPIDVKIGVDSLKIPTPPGNFVFAITPGVVPATDPPGVRIFP